MGKRSERVGKGKPHRGEAGPIPRRARSRGLSILPLSSGLLLVLAATLTLLGVVPGLSALAGTAGPADLGVRYGEAELSSALSKLSAREAGLDATLTEEELSAYIAYVAGEQEVELDQLQVRLSPGNKFQAAAMMELGGRDYPVFIEGRAEARGGELATSTLSKIRIAGLPLPGGQRERIEETIEREVSRRLSAGTGFELALLETGEGTVRIVGRQG